MAEHLIVLARGTPQQAFDALRARYRLPLAFPPRLLAGRLDEQDAADIARLPEVEAVVSRDRGTLPGSLDDNERLFAGAWLARLPGNKARAGEGESWDAPGFLPPDRPKKD